jgi:2-octaprenyl-6-methoxyphenol hydroxylase
MSDVFAADVIVAGGGPAGLVAANLLGAGGVPTALIAPPAPADNRTTALMQGSLAVLEQLGLWPMLAQQTGVLRRLRIIDGSNGLFRAPEALFEAEEVGLSAFGHNIENFRLVAALRDAAEARPSIRVFGSPASDIRPDADRVEASLADGGGISGRLLVGADGRMSVSRSAAGIQAHSRRYPQAAMTLNISHTRPHDDTSTEFHSRGGPFTLVPLPGDRSSVVLVSAPAEIDRLKGLNPAALGRELERRSHGLLGRITVDSAPAVRPLGSLVAMHFAARRIALVGEAAHVLPPIGAQGLNLGIRDAAAIADLALKAHASGGDPGAAALLDRYNSLRQRDVGPRALAVDLLNRSLLTGLLPVQAGRAAGLWAIARIPLIRRSMIRQGLALLPKPVA